MVVNSTDYQHLGKTSSKLTVHFVKSRVVGSLQTFRNSWIARVFPKHIAHCTVRCRELRRAERELLGVLKLEFWGGDCAAGVVADCATRNLCVVTGKSGRGQLSFRTRLVNLSTVFLVGHGQKDLFFDKFLIIYVHCVVPKWLNKIYEVVAF